MQLIVNGAPQAFDSAPTIEQLIDRLGLRERRLAVEVNRQIVPRSLHATHRLEDGDVLELVQAIGGG